MLRNRVVDFVEIYNVCARKAIIKVAKRKTNSDKICRSYSDLNFGVTFFGTQCMFTLHLARYLVEIFTNTTDADKNNNDNWCLDNEKSPIT